MSIAYQTLGGVPPDLVVPLPFLSHLEHNWEYPPVARFLELLGSLGRLTLFNQRGVGLSDPVAGVPTLEERMNDMLAVMDDAGVERATVLAMSDGGPVATLLAAAHPKRVERLLLYATFARRRSASALPAGDTDQLVAALSELWGSGAVASLSAPSLAEDERHRAWAGRLERLAASPGTIVRLAQASIETDVRGVLGNVRVPTTVMHREGDGVFAIEDGREVAALIPGARFVELAGRDHAIYVDYEEIIDEVAESLTGSRPHLDPHRLFAAILFTDIVESTARIARLGDEGWRELLEAHDRAVYNVLTRFGADNVRSTGDGFVATFDGPVRAIDAALASRAAARDLGLELRAGVHAGDCELIGDSIGGMAVHVAARVAALAAPSELLVTSAVRDLATGAEIAFEDHGSQTLKGVPERWRLFSVGRR